MRFKSKRGADESRRPPRGGGNEIAYHRSGPGAIEIHQSKRPAKVGQRKAFREIADREWQSLQRSKRAGKNKDREEKENRKLDRLCLGAREG